MSRSLTSAATPRNEQAPQTPVEEVKGEARRDPDIAVVQTKRIERMKQYFDNRPKVRIRIRKEEGEQWVQINGYAFRIQAGETVSVPVDVADILEQGNVMFSAVR